MSRLEDGDLNQDLIFTGPVTQEELILTWRKRQQERLVREKAETLRSEEKGATPETSEESKADTRNWIESVRVPEQTSVGPLAEEKTESAPLPPHSITNILRPTRLSIEPAPFTTPLAEEITESAQLPSHSITNILRPARLGIDPASFTTPLAEENASAQLPPHSITNILRPPRLNVDPASFTTDWARRINMKKLDKPKRPEYVLPVELEK